MPTNITGFDHSEHFEHVLRQVSTKTLVCGVPVNNDKLNMIALVQETGKHIQAKNYPYLVIPTGNAVGKKTSEIVGLYQRGHALGIDDPSQSNGFKVMFVLKQSVDIPARPFMRLTLNHHADEWTELFASEVLKVALNPQGTVDDVFKTVGKRMVADMKDTINKLSQPANAPLTAERKGFNNPLVDTGILRDSIDYFIVNKK